MVGGFGMLFPLGRTSVCWISVMIEASFFMLKRARVYRTDTGNPMKSATVSAASRSSVKKQHPHSPKFTQQPSEYAHSS